MRQGGGIGQERSAIGARKGKEGKGGALRAFHRWTTAPKIGNRVHSHGAAGYSGIGTISTLSNSDLRLDDTLADVCILLRIDSSTVLSVNKKYFRHTMLPMGL